MSCFNFADHCWNETDMLELRIFVIWYLQPGVLNTHLSLFVHTTEQFFKISLSPLRDFPKKDEDTLSLLLASFMPLYTQQVPRTGYQQLPSRPV